MHLSPDGWFDNIFIEGNYLWTPPPAAAQTAVKQLYTNYHLWEKSLHVVCIPCLVTFLWRKKLSKVADTVLSLPFDDKVWPLSNWENLILVIVLPFAHIRPWKLQGTQLVVKCERNMQEVWEKEEGLGGDHLRELLVSARTLDKLPGGVVRRLLLRGGRRKLSPD